MKLINWLLKQLDPVRNDAWTKELKIINQPIITKGTETKEVTYRKLIRPL